MLDWNQVFGVANSDVLHNLKTKIVLLWSWGTSAHVELMNKQQLFKKQNPVHYPGTK